MKKIITSVLAAAMVLSMSATAFAAETTDTTITPDKDNNYSPNPSTANTAVEFSIDPTYTVTIPAKVELAKKETDGAITYEEEMKITAAEVRLLEGKNIQVTMASDFNLETEAKVSYTLPYTVKVGENTIADNGEVARFVTSASEQTSTLHFAAKDPEYAGDYSDTVTFNIAIVDATN